MESLLTHPALVSIPAAFAVIIVSAMYLRHLVILGKSRDKEREAFLDVINGMGADFKESLSELNKSRLTEQKEMMDVYRQISLCMQTMVEHCKKYK